MTELDEHGQPRNRAFNSHRNLLKGVESLLGLCRGFLADHYLSDEEITFLDTWLKDNYEITTAWPGNVIGERVREVLQDGVITEEERTHLQETLEQLTGQVEDGVASGMATTLPVNDDCVVDFEGRTFCFTGQFIFGTRTRCQRAVEELGAKAIKGVRKDLDYLVIGALASRDWAHSSHGRKIEKAMANNEKGAVTAIISEEAWIRAFR